MSSGEFDRRGAAGPVRPPILALLVFAQLLSNGLVPGLGLAFLALLAWRRARRAKAFTIALVIVASLSAVFLAAVIVDVTIGPSVGYGFS